MSLSDDKCRVAFCLHTLHLTTVIFFVSETIEPVRNAWQIGQ
jgi:hypothetical protein